MVCVWDLYAKRAVLYGANVCLPSPSAIAILDRAQRCAGRVLLGFRKRSPGPAVLGELGWTRLSKELINERASLLGRLCQSNNRYVSMLIDITMAMEDSWLALTARGIRMWCNGALPSEQRSWDLAVRRCREGINKQEIRLQANLCATHPSLRHYVNAPWSRRQE